MPVKYTEDILRKAVSQSESISEVVRQLGITSKSGSLWNHIKSRLEFYNIDTSHFKGLRSNSGIKHKGGCKTKTAAEILVKLAPGSNRLPAKQLKRGLLEIGREYIRKCREENDRQRSLQKDA